MSNPIFQPKLLEHLETLTEEEVFLYLCETVSFEPTKRNRIDLFTLTDDDLIHLCRFNSRDLEEIARKLGLPPVISTPSRYSFTREEAFFLLCVRLASHTRYRTLSLLLGYSVSQISEVFNWMLAFMIKEWDFLLEDFSSGQLTIPRLEQFASHIHNRGAPLPQCWGFLDCTIRPICRPSQWQRTAYNGHKKTHALKYSAVKAPDGITYHLFGPYEGRRNDNALLHDSQLLDRCRVFAGDFYLFGDPTYPLSDVLQAPFSRIELSTEEKEFNKKMSRCRECVEWGFGEVVRLWSSLDFKPSQRIFSSAIGKHYRVATLLTNIHICLYGSQTSIFFNCHPPSLDEYLKKRE